MFPFKVGGAANVLLLLPLNSRSGWRGPFAALGFLRWLTALMRSYSFYRSIGEKIMPGMKRIFWLWCWC